MATPVKSHALADSSFYRLRSPHKLAMLLKVSLKDLGRLTAAGDTLYREFDIPKKTGDKRRVESPRDDLKKVQARIASLLGRITPTDYLFCPVKRRCYVTNAARHRGNRVVRCLDVRKYFPSTSARRVYWFFHKIMRCTSDVAGILTRLGTYRGHLPTGGPLSPILAYYAHYDVWENIAQITRLHKYTLSVYVDDVTISGPHVRASVLWEIKQAIHRSGLRYHKEKTFIDRPAEITGVIVAGDRLVIPQRQHLKLHATKIEMMKPENDGSKIIAGRLTGLRGQMSQIRQVDLRN